MTYTNSNDSHHILTLKDVASWQIDGLKSDGISKITARVPSLQRGAIWEPQQIEMLWDSIMRGFPIGSIVIAKRIDKQNDKRQITSANNSASSMETTHHILDGQQRCNAIAWGFVDPWNKECSDDVVLWLDLKPNDRLEKTTRKYLFRVTTKAHPWGFHHGDQAENLTSGNIKAFMNKLTGLHLEPQIWPEKFHGELISNQIQNKKIKRPSPKLAMPHNAGFPVPVSLLLKHFKNERLELDKLADEPIMKVIMFWSNLNITNFKNDENLKDIELGLKIISHARLVALQVPELVYGIDDIEQIFQRLNRQGTPLDNEELAYSLIKAHWPDIEEVMKKLPNELHHSTEARLIGLGVRVALTKLDDKKIAPELTVERIRNIFRKTNIKSQEDMNDQNLIKPFFENGEFQKALGWIDENFLYQYTRDYGLPAYLRSSLAWYSKDVFAWLMLLAKNYKYVPIDSEATIKNIIGLALTIHWFGEDKAKAVDILIQNRSLLNMPIDLNIDKNRPAVLIPMNPQEIDKAFQLGENSQPEQLKQWVNFWEGVVKRNAHGELNTDVDAENRRMDGLFINKLCHEKELLLYAQREYIANVFDGFDPSNKLMWKGHNRPWDYDHMLPTNNIGGTGNRNNDFTKVCIAWQRSIGNLIAVDFSFNRAAQDNADAHKKYANKEDIRVFSDNLTAFCMNHADTNDEKHSREFVLAAKNRLVAIYKEWYDTLNIGQRQ